MFDAMSPMEIAGIVLIVAGIWAAIELALTLRSSRKSLAELTHTVTDTVAEVKPVVQKLDGVVDELQQSSKQLEPLLEKTSVAVDAVTVDLIRVDDILSDVSTVTSTGANLSSAVSKVTASAADGVAGIVGKITSSASKTVGAKLGLSVSEATAALQDAASSMEGQAHSKAAGAGTGANADTNGTGSETYSAKDQGAQDTAQQNAAPAHKSAKPTYFTYPDSATGTARAQSSATDKE